MRLTDAGGTAAGIRHHVKVLRALDLARPLKLSFTWRRVCWRLKFLIHLIAFTCAEIGQLLVQQRVAARLYNAIRLVPYLLNLPLDSEAIGWPGFWEKNVNADRNRNDQALKRSKTTKGRRHYVNDRTPKGVPGAAPPPAHGG
eukprot:4289387-Pleurochrysis_carterae.AAC.1